MSPRIEATTGNLPQSAKICDRMHIQSRADHAAFALSALVQSQSRVDILINQTSNAEYAANNCTQLDDEVRERLAGLNHPHHDGREVKQTIHRWKTICRCPKVICDTVLVGLQSSALNVDKFGRDHFDIVLIHARPRFCQLDFVIERISNSWVVLPKRKMIDRMADVDCVLVGENMRQNVEVLSMHREMEISCDLADLKRAINVATLTQLFFEFLHSLTLITTNINLVLEYFAIHLALLVYFSLKDVFYNIQFVLPGHVHGVKTQHRARQSVKDNIKINPQLAATGHVDLQSMVP
mmetsp:Transcript_8904/g.20426  ORF Transcript_8904/g.20426 Transcript_8904/m.20426 type:complete len:295 (+) Transcript_8904:143-1027(+)